MMKRTKILYKKKEEDLLNTNEVIPDFEFHLQMLIEQKKMDFENLPESSEIPV